VCRPTVCVDTTFCVFDTVIHPAFGTSYRLKNLPQQQRRRKTVALKED